MSTNYSGGRTAMFEELRRRLFAIAYRMIGMKADAEDIVQEAYVRWHEADADEVRSPEAWLVSVVTRLSIDRMRKVTVEREKYVGPWLPEPIFLDTARSPQEDLELSSDISTAFLLMLERLGPVERAAFLLHDVFDCAYPVIARILRKSEATCRQLVHRARDRVRTERRRFTVQEEDKRRLVEKFVAAANAGDESTLLSLFAEDAILTSDGGGVVPAARKVVHGRHRIARLFLVLARKLRGRLTVAIQPINGAPGLAFYLEGAPFAVTTFETTSSSILAVYTLLNPEKLTGIPVPQTAKEISD